MDKAGKYYDRSSLAELSRLNSFEQLAVTVVLRTHEKLLFISALTGDDMKRISLLGGLKDRTLAEKALGEEYSLKQIIQDAINRESSRANAEVLRNRPT